MFDPHESPDYGMLGLAVDGHLQPLALELGIAYQRVQQILADGSDARFTRILRPLARVAPNRAEDVVRRLVQIIAEECGHARPCGADHDQHVARLAKESGELISVAIGFKNDFERQLKEAREKRDVLNSFISWLEHEIRLNREEASR